MYSDSLYKKYSFAIAVFAVLTVGFSDPVNAQSKPFPITSISFPLIGSNYLDDIPGWTPIPTVIQQIQALGANDVRVMVSTVVVRSGTAIDRTIALRTPIAEAMRTMSAYADALPGWAVVVAATTAAMPSKQVSIASPRATSMG